MFVGLYYSQGEIRYCRLEHSALLIHSPSRFNLFHVSPPPSLLPLYNLVHQNKFIPLTKEFYRGSIEGRLDPFLISFSSISFFLSWFASAPGRLSWLSCFLLRLFARPVTRRLLLAAIAEHSILAPPANVGLFQLNPPRSQQDLIVSRIADLHTSLSLYVPVRYK